MGGEMESTKDSDEAKSGSSLNQHGHDGDIAIAGCAPSRTKQDSWVDAVVTLLATVIFGLGWTLVELERADPPSNRYAATASEMWVAAVATSIQTRAIEAAPADRRGDEDARWAELALQSSSR